MQINTINSQEARKIGMTAVQAEAIAVWHDEAATAAGVKGRREDALRHEVTGFRMWKLAHALRS